MLLEVRKMPDISFSEVLKSLVFEEEEVSDPKKIDKIVEYLIENNVPIEIEIAGKGVVGVRVPKDPKIASEIVEKLDIPENELGIYMNKAMRKIAEVLSQKLFHNEEPKTELEKKVIDVLYSKNLKTKAVLKQIPIMPIYENSDIVEASLKDENDNLIRYYVLHLTYDKNGHGRTETFSLALTEEELAKILKQIREVIENENESNHTDA